MHPDKTAARGSWPARIRRTSEDARNAAQRGFGRNRELQELRRSFRDRRAETHGGRLRVAPDRQFPR